MNRLERFRIWLAVKLVTGLGWRERKDVAKQIYPMFRRSVCVGNESVTLTVSQESMMTGWDINGASIILSPSTGKFAIVFDGMK